MLTEQRHIVTDIDPRARVMLMAVREGLLLIIAALENYLGLPRTKQRNG